MTTQNAPFEEQSHHNTQNTHNDDIAARIEASPLSESMKANMRLVHTHLVGIQFGLPQYDLKGTQIWATMSNFAFFFSLLYYVAKGLWRKAIVLFAIGVVINAIITFISVLMDTDFLFPINFLGALIVSWLSMHSAYSDIYRAKILEQKFWW